MSCSFVVIIKPDAVARKLEFDIIRDFAEAGFQVGRHMTILPGDERWFTHYQEHAAKPHYNDLCTEMAARPAIAFEMQIKIAASPLDKLLIDARKLTLELRTKYADHDLPLAQRRRHNSIHCSDNSIEAAAEVALWFRAPATTDKK